MQTEKRIHFNSFYWVTYLDVKTNKKITVGEDYKARSFHVVLANQIHQCTERMNNVIKWVLLQEFKVGLCMKENPFYLPH